MIAPGVTMVRAVQRRERTGIIQIVVIAAVLLAALYGGLRLLGSTYAAWELRQSETAARAEQLRAPDRRAAETRAAEAKLSQLNAIRRSRAQLEADMQAGQLRCINGQLFRRLDNGWENLPGRSCE